MTLPISAIDPADIPWACKVMGLPPGAFDPIDGDDSRRSAILNLETADYEACPGSGKTTLLVAKLAILANRWPSRRQGICVLSHTNAARNEIGSRLSSCSAGSALLRYPHFVGTIHSFVNEFLAIPWLRSKGWPICAIDTELALTRRWNRVPYKTRMYLGNKHIDKYALAYSEPNFSGGEKGSLEPHQDTYKLLSGISEASSKEGYFCYDEMFVWAKEHLDQHSETISALRRRFPIVFIDEAQDNSELQSSFLSRLFCSGVNPARRQRFGDSNQAIYNHADQLGATTDRFPGSAKHDIPRSFRFGQEIANRAKPLGVVPQNLVGAGPPLGLSQASKASTILLFDKATVGDVLSRYGALLLELFAPEDLSTGVFTAVAGVHDKDDPTKVPCSMVNYAPSYNAACSRKEATPDTFAQHLARARFRMTSSPDAHPLVTAIADAVLQLARLFGAEQQLSKRRSPHRLIRERLADSSTTLIEYDELVSFILDRRGDLTLEDWNGTALTLVLTIAAVLADGAADTPEVQEFITWPQSLQAVENEPQEYVGNVFTYPPKDPKIHIRLGSIHSVKGETHTATLVLDSFYYAHHLQQLKPWLLGVKSGGAGGSSRLQGRLRLHYVAMTRPTHFLCLAMSRDAFTAGEIATLRSQGWTVIDPP